MVGLGGTPPLCGQSEQLPPQLTAIHLAPREAANDFAAEDRDRLRMVLTGGYALSSSSHGSNCPQAGTASDNVPVVAALLFEQLIARGGFLDRFHSRVALQPTVTTEELRYLQIRRIPRMAVIGDHARRIPVIVCSGAREYIESYFDDVDDGPRKV